MFTLHTHTERERETMPGVTKHYKNMNSQTYFSLLSAQLHILYAHKHTAFEKL